MEFETILITCTITLIVISVIQKITHNDMIKACTVISVVIAVFVVIAMALAFRVNSETFWALSFGAWAINVISSAGDDD